MPSASLELARSSTRARAFMYVRIIIGAGRLCTCHAARVCRCSKTDIDRCKWRIYNVATYTHVHMYMAVPGSS